MAYDYQKSDGKRRANPAGGKIFPDIASGRFWQTNPPATRSFRGRVTPHPAITRRAVFKVPHPIVPMRGPLRLAPFSASARHHRIIRRLRQALPTASGRQRLQKGPDTARGGRGGPVSGRWSHPGSGCPADWCRMNGLSDTFRNTRRHCLMRQEPPRRQGQASKGACPP